MKTPACACMMREYERKYRNNPHYGKPEQILISSEDHATVSCNHGRNGTVRMKQNFCGECGKAYKEIEI